MLKIMMVGINFSNLNEVSREYQIPSKLDEKTYDLFEKREFAIQEKLNLNECDDWGLEYQFDQKIFFDFSGLCDYIREWRN